MAKRDRAGDDNAAKVRGNYVSEWFGHRVYPVAVSTAESLADQSEGRCPFLTEALETDRPCIKPAGAKGICTISTHNSGVRADWLVCPYRALDLRLLQQVARRSFKLPADQHVHLAPASRIGDLALRSRLWDGLQAGDAVIVYFQDKLGGEIALSPSDNSPELSFDVTMVQIVQADCGPSLGRYAILEVQTMDFHGSYRYVVRNLQDGLRMHRGRFPEVLSENVNWLSEKIEGPNIANVFKRTFYQMVLKFKLAGHETCAGTTLAVPRAVWDSWQRHLGQPQLTPGQNGAYRLRPVDLGDEAEANSWIYVLDLKVDSPETPTPLRVGQVIETNAEALIRAAFESAPQFAMQAGGPVDRIIPSIYGRLHKLWPELV